MNRKWMVTGWIGALALSVLILGCPKKAPEPMAPAPPPPPPPPQEVPEPAPPPPVVDVEPDPLAGDIQEVNRHVARMGLVGDVYFDFDKYDLRADARNRLAKNSQFMKANPQFRFEVQGHCDERGTNDYNLALGDRRSNAAKDYLASLGVRSGTFRTISYGEEKPLCTVSDESCWWKNRRAHFVITGRTGG